MMVKKTYLQCSLLLATPLAWGAEQSSIIECSTQPSITECPTTKTVHLQSVNEKKYIQIKEAVNPILQGRYGKYWHPNYTKAHDSIHREFVDSAKHSAVFVLSSHKDAPLALTRYTHARGLNGETHAAYLINNCSAESLKPSTKASFNHDLLLYYSVMALKMRGYPIVYCSSEIEKLTKNLQKLGWQKELTHNYEHHDAIDKKTYLVPTTFLSFKTENLAFYTKKLKERIDFELENKKPAYLGDPNLKTTITYKKEDRKNYPQIEEFRQEGLPFWKYKVKEVKPN